MATREELGARARPGPLLIDLRRTAVLRRVFDVAGEEGGVVRLRAGAVGDDVLAPAVEDVAVRVGEPERDIGVELVSPRLVAEDAGVGDAHRRAVGRLDLR